MVSASARQKEYREVYLRSEHWRCMRLTALEDAGHRCAVCNGRKSLDVHHRTYERLGEERLTDLLVLCRTCHDIFHSNGRLSGQPKKTKKAKRRAAKTGKTKNVAPKKSALAIENERLHAFQQRNKRQRQLVRDGFVSPSTRASLAHRTRA